MNRSRMVPTLSNGLKTSKFKILPLRVLEDGSLGLVNIASLSTRAEFSEMLLSLCTNEQRVAIQDERGYLVSCGTNVLLPDAIASRPAQYSKIIGTSEQFRIHYCMAKGTFALESLLGDNLFLTYSPQFKYLTLQNCELGEATWMIYPIGIEADPSTFDAPTERLVFAGVVSINGEILLGRTAEGEGPQWKTDLDKIIQCVCQSLPDGTSSIFVHPITNHQWSIVRYDEQSITIVVGSNRFPLGLLAECHDDLTALYKKAADSKRIEKMAKLGLKHDQVLGKELAALMMDYDDMYRAGWKKKRSKLEQEIYELQDKMGVNIENLQNNLYREGDMLAKTDELLELSKQFKKRAARMPNGWRRTTILVGTGLGLGTGALVGWLIGGPGGSLILASEGAEIATAAAATAVLGGAIGSNQTVSFWSRRFVKLMPWT